MKKPSAQEHFSFVVIVRRRFSVLVDLPRSYLAALARRMPIHNKLYVHPKVWDRQWLRKGP